MERGGKARSARKTVLHKGEFLSLVRKGGYEFAERVGATGVVSIIAVTPEGNMLFVEQQRAPLGTSTIELVAGLVGDVENDTLPAAAERELLEETGYEAMFFEHVIDAPLEGGTSSTLISFFYAHGVKKVGLGGGVELEDITVHEIPIDEAYDWLMKMSKTERLVDPRVFLGLEIARRQLASKK